MYLYHITLRVHYLGVTLSESKPDEAWLHDSLWSRIRVAPPQWRKEGQHICQQIFVIVNDEPNWWAKEVYFLCRDFFPFAALTLADCFNPQLTRH